MGSGFDEDSELLNLLHSGVFGDARVGKYLVSLQAHFPGEVVVDSLCCLRLHTELSIRARGLSIMREAGFEADIEGDQEIQGDLAELKHLEQSIGKAGKLAVVPCLGDQSRDVCQLSMLKRVVNS